MNKKQIDLKYAWFMAFAICVLTFLVMRPVVENGFTNWDDHLYVMENQLVIQEKINWTGLFSEPVVSNYHPLTVLSLALDYRSDGLSAESFHSTNLVLHVLNVLLCYWFVFTLTRGNLFLTASVTLCFAIHPMHVESVAWVSSRKDVLYTFFFFAACIAWLRKMESGSMLWYVAALLLFIGSVLSKPMAVVFPLVMIMMSWYVNGKWSAAQLREAIPFFLVSLVMSWITWQAQKDTAIAEAQTFALWERLIFGFSSLGFYISKFVLPIDLAPYYSYPVRPGADRMPVQVIISAVVAASILILVFRATKHSRLALFGLLFFLINMILVLQFISVGMALTADRYTYLSYTGLTVLLFVPLNHSFRNDKVRWAFLIFLAIGMSIMSRNQIAVWKNSGTLWTRVIEVNKDKPYLENAYVNRGRYYRELGMEEEAMSDYRHAIRYNSEFGFAYNNRGNIYLDRGQLDSAFSDYNVAVTLDPDNYLFLANRGNMYRNMKEFARAEEDLNKSIELNAHYWANYYNRGLLLFETNRDVEAIRDFSTALQLNPGYADLYYRKAMSLVRMKKFSEALDDLNQAISFDGQKANYWLYRSYCYKQLGMEEEASRDLAEGNRLLDAIEGSVK